MKARPITECAWCGLPSHKGACGRAGAMPAEIDRLRNALTLISRANSLSLAQLTAVEALLVPRGAAMIEAEAAAIRRMADAIMRSRQMGMTDREAERFWRWYDDGIAKGEPLGALLGTAPGRAMVDARLALAALRAIAEPERDGAEAR